MTELQIIAAKLEAAECPEAVFGATADELRTAFLALLKAVHPDHNGGSPLADAATARLYKLKAAAMDRVAAGTYGERLPLPEFERMDLHAYRVVRRPVVGDVADVFLGEREAVKVARSSDDNDLLRAERRALEAVAAKCTTVVKQGFPVLLDRFQTGGREANVLGRLPAGFVSAREATRRAPQGVDPRALVWMMKRVLSVLDWAHHLGFVHGGILPDHVWFYPDNYGAAAKPGERHPYKHSVRIIGWCGSVEWKSRTRLSTWSPAWRGMYPPELLNKSGVGPPSDIYMAAQLVHYLAGGVALPSPLLAVWAKCASPRAEDRYQTCAEASAAWIAAAAEVYGAPKWTAWELPS